jgi:hypothetical protein
MLRLAAVLASLAPARASLNSINTVAGAPFASGETPLVKAPASVSVSAQGNVIFVSASSYVATVGTSGGLLRLAGGGTGAAQGGAATAAALQVPLTATAAGLGGAFLVLSKAALYAVSAAGAATTLIDGSGAYDAFTQGGVAALGARLTRATAIAVHPSTGLVYLAEYFAIYKVDTTAAPPRLEVAVGAESTSMACSAWCNEGAAPIGINGLGDVTSMAFAPNGHLYFVEASSVTVR